MLLSPEKELNYWQILISIRKKKKKKEKEKRKRKKKKKKEKRRESGKRKRKYKKENISGLRQMILRVFPACPLLNDILLVNYVNKQ